MKNLLTVLLLSLSALVYVANAQGEVEPEAIQPDTTSSSVAPTIPVGKKATVYESDESMSKGIQNALIVEVPSSDEKLVESVWKKFIRDYGGKTKKSKGGRNEYVTKDAEIVGINGVNPLTIYSSAGPGAEGNIEMRVWFDLGEEFLESERTKEFAEAQRLLQKFAHEVEIENTKKELKAAEKKLKRLESELKSLKRQNESYHQAIENYKKKIMEAEENIVTNIEQQADTSKKIELQKELADEIERRLKALKKL